MITSLIKYNHQLNIDELESFFGWPTNEIFVANISKFNGLII